jgi:hypothetical protein
MKHFLRLHFHKVWIEVFYDDPRSSISTHAAGKGGGGGGRKNASSTFPIHSFSSHMRLRRLRKSRKLLKGSKERDHRLDAVLPHPIYRVCKFKFSFRYVLHIYRTAQ